jgi:hypothetical protein
MTAKTQSQRNRASEARKLAEGARRLPGVLLPAQAAQDLDYLRTTGYAPSVAACIARALREAAATRS